MTITGDGKDTRQALRTLRSNELGVVKALGRGPADDARIAADAGILVSEVKDAIATLEQLGLVRPAEAPEHAGCYELNAQELRTFLSQVRDSSKQEAKLAREQSQGEPADATPADA